MTVKFNGTRLVEIYWSELYVKGFNFLDEKGGIIAKVGKPEYDYYALPQATVKIAANEKIVGIRAKYYLDYQ
jgi:hypothetical protein